jgi:hypothetical protein
LSQTACETHDPSDRWRMVVTRPLKGERRREALVAGERLALAPGR